MLKVSLTTFVDFATASGSTRLTKVRRAKSDYASDYAPQRDFYKGFREAVESQFEAGWDGAKLKKRLKKVRDDKKKQNYELCRKGLAKWVGKKKIVAHEKQGTAWKSGELTVRVNPEVDLDINGQRHLVKLYLKGEPISKQKADVILHLIASQAPKGVIPAVLDVRRSKLYVPTVAKTGMGALLKAEAAAFLSLWNAV